MRRSTVRHALGGMPAALALILGASVTGAAAASAPPAAVGFGVPAAAGTAGHPCRAGGSACVSGDRAVQLAWSAAGSTAGCVFRLVIDWGDGGARQTVRLAGGTAARVWPAGHVYAGRVSARRAYRITAEAAVLADPQRRGCTIAPAAVTFTLLCTPAQLSGPAWNARFPGGDRDLDHLNATFGPRVKAFAGAMARAGITVQPQSTLRSPQRSYLMNVSYRVAKGLLTPQAVPAYVPVAAEKGPSVCWTHRDAAGRADARASVAAARSLLTALGVDPSLRTPPGLRSRHNTGDAVDMRIAWTAPAIAITDATGRTVRITSGPRDGTNPQLIAVGASYGVRHFFPVAVDRNHWSVDGR